jgi:hypothetical protein
MVMVPSAPNGELIFIPVSAADSALASSVLAFLMAAS